MSAVPSRPAPAARPRLKVCVVTSAHWGAVMGGSQYQAKMLVEHLLSTGSHDVFYLARRVPVESGEFAGHMVRRIARPDGWRRYGEVLDSWDLLRLLKEISPDVIYQRVGCAYTGVAAYYAKTHGKRCVWHVASDADVMPFDGRLSRNVVFRYADKLALEYGLRNADAIVTQTNQQARYLWNHYRRRADATIPNYHPPTTDRRDKNGPIKVVWVANVKDLKRPELFIRLARDFAHVDGVEFIMIGKPMGRAEWCRDVVQQASEAKNLRYLGEQPQETVNRVLAGAHLFVNTSTYEGFPNTFIQAWLNEVPVLSLCVNPDGVFDDGRVGVCAGSYESLQRNLAELIENHALREAMGRQARQHAQANHANPANLDKLVGILTGDLV